MGCSPLESNKVFIFYFFYFRKEQNFSKGKDTLQTPLKGPHPLHQMMTKGPLK